MWYENNAVFKENRAVVKLRKPDGAFIKSIIIPTAYYPLNSNYEVFTYKNTKPMNDDGILKIFDSVKYQLGHCYTNTGELVRKLNESGYDAKSYAGWLFTDAGDLPVHHCWCVIEKDGEKSVLDLSDDFTAMLSGENGENFKDCDANETRELIASFHEAAASVPNSLRCSPVGTPTPFLLYIGCECPAEDARKLYGNLMRQYPDHECESNCDSTGLNATQRLIFRK